MLQEVMVLTNVSYSYSAVDLFDQLLEHAVCHTQLLQACFCICCVL